MLTLLQSPPFGIDRLSQGLAWVGTAAEALIRTVERALGGKG